MPGQQSGDVVVNGNAQSHVWVEIAHQLAIDGKAESLFLGVKKLQEGVFLDPWGIPYSIAFDMDNDGYCTIGDEIRVASHSGIFVWSTGLWQTIAQ